MFRWFHDRMPREDRWGTRVASVSTAFCDIGKIL